MVQKILGAQRDFSSGEIDVALKRNDDHPARKTGLRQMSNMRILNSGAAQSRPGRRALYPHNVVRTERFSVSSSNVFDIQFAAGVANIINSSGVVVASFTRQGNGAVLPWVTASDISSIVYAVLSSAATVSVYITFGHAMRPQVITFDGVSTWIIVDYNEALIVSGQKRTPFYRISPQNVSMLPSAVVGNITVEFSSPICVAGMVGTRMRFCNRQILLTSLVSPTVMNATVVEPLPPGVLLALTVSRGNFAIGDLVEGIASGAKGIVTASPSQQSIEATGIISPNLAVGQTVTGGTSGATGVVTSIDPFNIVFAVSLKTTTAFVVGETITGPSGSVTSFSVSPVNMTVQLLQSDNDTLNMFIAAAGSIAGEGIAGPSGNGQINTVTITTPQAVAVWDDEIMNSFRGFPGSVFVDQYRLGFCDFPQIPGGIGWSAINSPTDLYVGANPSDAMFEIAPDKVRILYVVPGPESSEFVFADRKLYYIPISPTNPLKPGSVQFQILSGDGSAPVQPRLSQEAILYANAGQNSIMAVIATGAYLRPFNTKNLTSFHAHLFDNIQCIAAPSADGTFNERYAYVLNGDGSIAIGKYDPDSLTSSNSPVIGWGPWSGAATVKWIGAFRSDVLFTSYYFGSGIIEILDDTQYLDCALPVNAVPAALAPLPGRGPLWFIAGNSVSLMDQGTRSMGTYQVDASGFIIPQNNGGENLAAASLVAGQPWTSVVEPFCPDAAPGTDVGQRMFKRRVSRFAAYVIQSSGFIMARLFSGPVTRTSPPLGTVMNTYRVPAYFQDDDATKPPPLRETAERSRPVGRAFDPRVAIIKDSPGPFLVAEIGIEATI